jgi:hypothetical protein
VTFLRAYRHAMREGRCFLEGPPMLKSPKLVDIGHLVRVLEKNPFGSLVLVLLILSVALTVWAAAR